MFASELCKMNFVNHPIFTLLDVVDARSTFFDKLPAIGALIAVAHYSVLELLLSMLVFDVALIYHCFD